jgi:hypothetical protein
MSKTLIIALIIFSIIWLIIILRDVKKGSISIKYSLIWLLMALILLLVGVFPSFMEYVAELFGFTTISNLVIGIILSLLMLITLVLTHIVTKQKNQIRVLTQEVALIKKKVNKKK